ncbi:hypothetical protein [Actinoplanes sp. URMC 104]|uniref:hypothetical protein n=1 Tax=Actinoplanes sp. URMC 104 TaxID=3423409 RepID=UPI003F1CA97F
MPAQLMTHRPWRIAAIQWTGHNFDEVEQFVRDYIGPDDETGVRNEPDEGWPREKFAYNTVQFTVYGGGSTDDLDIDPGQWIVVHLDIPADQGSIERVEIVADSDELSRAYQPAADEPNRSGAPA